MHIGGDLIHRSSEEQTFRLEVRRLLSSRSVRLLGSVVPRPRRAGGGYE